MRVLLINMARMLPSKVISDRILPWLTLTLATFGAVWTLFQYSDGVGIQRANTTLAIHRQFLDSFPEGAQTFTQISDDERVRRILKLRCEFYETAAAGKKFKLTMPLPNCSTISVEEMSVLDEIGKDISTSLRAELRGKMATLVPLDYGPARRMMTFFRSLQVCVEISQCNLEISGELFAGDIVAFLNATCPLALNDKEFARNGALLGTFTRTLLPLGVIPWNIDPSREDLFACNYLRMDI